MYPHLIEKNIMYVLKDQLSECNKKKNYTNTLIFNISVFFMLSFIITFILYIKYKGKQDVSKLIENENKKKNYILSKLHFYQKMKSKEYTNMTI